MKYNIGDIVSVYGKWNAKVLRTPNVESGCYHVINTQHRALGNYKCVYEKDISEPIGLSFIDGKCPELVRFSGRIGGVEIDWKLMVAECENALTSLQSRINKLEREKRKVASHTGKCAVINNRISALEIDRNDVLLQLRAAKEYAGIIASGEEK